ncbi:MAG: prepilin-type N-terminal cleavage/methylation domain-containing protein [Elusimicrobiota bacterium]|jgi:prepilin-type N-terminal cleavage/methylation domain-containing protein|nr:prepilin-type N-terminal cleavage/methylation domain-containing protein [Elusimicrobiota bacterium]
MKKGGFTLIEILVVALIIGVLAAVALPKYQRFILRTKISNLAAFMRSMGAAQERYKMMNGAYTIRLAALDVGDSKCFAKPLFPDPADIPEFENNHYANYLCDGVEYSVSRHTDGINLDTNQNVEQLLIQIRGIEGPLKGFFLSFGNEFGWKMNGCGEPNNETDFCEQLLDAFNT